MSLFIGQRRVHKLMKRRKDKNTKDSACKGLIRSSEEKLKIG